MSVAIDKIGLNKIDMYNGHKNYWKRRRSLPNMNKNIKKKKCLNNEKLNRRRTRIFYSKQEMLSNDISLPLNLSNLIDTSHISNSKKKRSSKLSNTQLLSKIEENKINKIKFNTHKFIVNCNNDDNNDNYNDNELSSNYVDSLTLDYSNDIDDIDEKLDKTYIKLCSTDINDTINKADKLLNMLNDSDDESYIIPQPNNVNYLFGISNMIMEPSQTKDEPKSTSVNFDINDKYASIIDCDYDTLSFDFGLNNGHIKSKSTFL